MDEFETTRTNSEAFEKWYKQHDTLSEYSARVAWQAATAERDKLVTELQAKNSELSASINVLREALSGYEYTLQGFSTELWSKQLLAKVRADLASTPAQSLQEHDNEVIEQVVTILKDFAWGDGIIDMRVDDLIEDVRKLKGK